MADERDAQAVDPCRRPVVKGARIAPGPILAPAAQLPAQELGKPAILRSVEVEKRTPSKWSLGGPW